MSFYDDEYDMIFKILIIGDSGVGKSNLLLRYVKNEFMPDMRSTVGVEFGSKLLKIENYQVKAQIWDTAGQERYRAITNAYYKGAKGVLIVYDITKKESFNNIDKWLNDFKMKCDENAAIIFVGNKSDLQEERKVLKEEAALKAQTNNFAFFETSAKTNENVDEAFNCLIAQVVKNFKNILEEKKQQQINKNNLKDNNNNNNNNKIMENIGDKSIKLDIDNINNENQEINIRNNIRNKNSWCCY